MFMFAYLDAINQEPFFRYKLDEGNYKSLVEVFNANEMIDQAMVKKITRDDLFAKLKITKNDEVILLIKILINNCKDAIYIEFKKGA